MVSLMVNRAMVFIFRNPHFTASQDDSIPGCGRVFLPQTSTLRILSLMILCLSPTLAEVHELFGHSLQDVMFDIAHKSESHEGVSKAKALPPYGVAFSPDGSQLYFGDAAKNRIRLLDIKSGFTTTLAGAGQRGLKNGAAKNSRFSWPYGVAVSPDGSTLYVADSGNDCVRSVSVSTGIVSSLAGSGMKGFADGPSLEARFSYPYGVAVSPDGGTVYVADSGNNLVRQIDVHTGDVTSVAGDGTAGYLNGPAENAKFYGLRSLVVSKDARKAYIADYGNHRVRVLEFETNLVSTLHGSEPKGLKEGFTITVEQFYRPAGVAITDDGYTVLIADSTNTRIRAIQTPEGELHASQRSASAATSILAGHPDHDHHPHDGHRVNATVYVASPGLLEPMKKVNIPDIDQEDAFVDFTARRGSWFEGDATWGRVEVRRSYMLCVIGILCLAGMAKMGHSLLNRNARAGYTELKTRVINTGVGNNGASPSLGAEVRSCSSVDLNSRGKLSSSAEGNKRSRAQSHPQDRDAGPPSTSDPPVAKPEARPKGLLGLEVPQFLRKSRQLLSPLTTPKELKMYETRPWPSPETSTPEPPKSSKPPLSKPPRPLGDQRSESTKRIDAAVDSWLSNGQIDEDEPSSPPPEAVLSEASTTDSATVVCASGVGLAGPRPRSRGPSPHSSPPKPALPRTSHSTSTPKGRVGVTSTTATVPATEPGTTGSSGGANGRSLLDASESPTVAQRRSIDRSESSDTPAKATPYESGVGSGDSAVVGGVPSSLAVASTRGPSPRRISPPLTENRHRGDREHRAEQSAARPLMSRSMSSCQMAKRVVEDVGGGGGGVGRSSLDAESVDWDSAPLLRAAAYLHRNAGVQQVGRLAPHVDPACNNRVLRCYSLAQGIGPGAGSHKEE